MFPGMPAGAGGWDNGMSGERSGKRRSPCSGGDEGAQHVDCYGDWTGELDLEERRTRG